MPRRGMGTAPDGRRPCRAGRAVLLHQHPGQVGLLLRDVDRAVFKLKRGWHVHSGILWLDRA
jgi:hypothetical protein